MSEEPSREVRRRMRARRRSKPIIAQRRAALLCRIGMTMQQAAQADGGRILSAVVAAGAHRVSEAEASLRAATGTPKALQWLAEDVTLLSGRRAVVRDVRRWLAANAPAVLVARVAAWEEATPYQLAETQPQRWANPDAAIARWERRRDYREGQS